MGNAPPPSGMCTLGPDLVFLGSWGGDSLLVQASPEQPQVCLRTQNAVFWSDVQETGLRSQGAGV